MPEHYPSAVCFINSSALYSIGPVIQHCIYARHNGQYGSQCMMIRGYKNAAEIRSATFLLPRDAFRECHIPLSIVFVVFSNVFLTIESL